MFDRKPNAHERIVIVALAHRLSLTPRFRRAWQRAAKKPQAHLTTIRFLSVLLFPNAVLSENVVRKCLFHGPAAGTWFDPTSHQGRYAKAMAKRYGRPDLIPPTRAARTDEERLLCIVP